MSTPEFRHPDWCGRVRCVPPSTNRDGVTAWAHVADVPIAVPTMAGIPYVELHRREELHRDGRVVEEFAVCAVDGPHDADQLDALAAAFTRAAEALRRGLGGAETGGAR